MISATVSRRMDVCQRLTTVTGEPKQKRAGQGVFLARLHAVKVVPGSGCIWVSVELPRPNIFQEAYSTVAVPALGYQSATNLL